MLRVVSFLLVAFTLGAQTPPRVLQSLKGVPVPEPAGLSTYITNRAAAIALGKALFWDVQVGSDGKVACASCHFQAGSDLRLRNQNHPGANNAFNPTRTNLPAGPGYRMTPGDFPTYVLADALDRNSAISFSTDDRMASQGVALRDFVSATSGASEDVCTDRVDPQFQANRRTTPRHSPTVINAVFNHRNFFDGRAPNAWTITLYRGATLAAANVTLNNASLAAQAMVPPVSNVEMGCNGRTWPDVGRRLYKATALRRQLVAADDSVLASYRAARGLNVTYEALIRQAFASNLWNSTGTVSIGGRTFTQPEANFAFFFGLAIQLYEATLISDDAPFDRYWAAYPSTDIGTASALTSEEITGMNVFLGKGRCVSCHSGPQLTNAGTPSHLATSLTSAMTLGDGIAGAYDFGFYNIGVRPTSEDLGVGAPGLSLTRQQGITGRTAVDGAFKTPNLRNLALSGPFFHNGSLATIEEVIDFYNRGGNARGTVAANDSGLGANPTNIGPDIRGLALAPFEKSALAAFLRSALLDQRVLFERAPFDHPELPLVEGNTTTLIPAVGRAGRSAPVSTFEQVLANGGLGYPPVVANRPPVVTITSPAAGASFTAPASINIAANASDPDGNLARVEFFNGSTRLGEDTAAPFTFNWTNVAAGNYTINVRAIDTDGAAANASVAVTVTSAPPPGGNGLQGEYYGRPDFTDLRFQRVDPRVDFSWGAAGPGNGLNASSYSVRWTGFLEGPETVLGVLCSTADSGMKVIVDDVVVVDNTFDASGVTSACGTFNFVRARRHALRVDYFNNNGTGRAQLLWWYPGAAFETIPSRALFPATPAVLGTGWRGEYFEGIDFRTSRFVRTDAAINFRWPATGPGSGLSNKFSVRWTTQMEAPATETFTFCGTSDDGLVMRINGQLVVDNDGDHTEQTACGTFAMVKGQRYSVETRYYSNAGVGVAVLRWWYPGGVFEVIPARWLFP